MPKRTTGTNAPGGKWNATPNERRGRPAIPVTLSPDGWGLVDRLCRRGESRGKLFERLAVAEAMRQGVAVPKALRGLAPKAEGTEEEIDRPEGEDT